ncbi:unnamed protein product [Parascedosporium putredinis]|uniref:NAD(P)-binding domain-containing protein n=1 Tax=Parascedosporium putredinis TaxID=1442378 RepID=A0A9P1MF58_9PEZI|nr:unnamed protein product [Parascedosporium putredinis]CAI8002830.1 unnamed protein product [Parascedosporium putredinis]
MSKNIAFFGASTGCGLAALRHSLAAGYTCTALCRNPGRLTTALSATESTPAVPQDKLRVVQGNAHSVEDVARCLAAPGTPTGLVDAVVFSIGGAFQWKSMKIDDPTVCDRGVETLLAAISKLRAEGAGSGSGTGPKVVVVSTTGISEFGRDIPLAMIPLYAALRSPHADKKKMEERIRTSGEAWTAVRPSLLVEEGEDEKGEKAEKEIRVGEYLGKAVTITY